MLAQMRAAASSNLRWEYHVWVARPRPRNGRRGRGGEGGPGRSRVGGCSSSKRRPGSAVPGFDSSGGRPEPCSAQSACSIGPIRATSKQNPYVALANRRPRPL